MWSHTFDKYLAQYKNYNEFEIRFRDINNAALVSYKNHMGDNAIVETTLNVISSNQNKNYIQTCIFDPTNIDKPAKKKIGVIKDVLYTEVFKEPSINRSFKLSLSKEQQVELSKLPPVTSKTIYRFKYRYSYKLNEYFRVDLTKTKTLLSKDVKNLVSEKLAFFKESFENIDKSKGHVAELEIEYIGNDNSKITEEMVKDAIINVVKIIDPYYSDKALIEELKIVGNYYYSSNARVNILARNNKLTLKSVTNQAKTLTKNSYLSIFPPIGYFLTDKADGEHCVIIIQDSYVKILSSHLEIIKLQRPLNTLIIAEGEMIFDTKTDKFTYHLFDVLVFKTLSLINMSFNTRMNYLIPVQSILNSIINVRVKKFYQITDEKSIKLNVHKILNEKREYNIDGIILNEPDKSYPNMNIYKWKPYENNTIDFYVRLVPTPFCYQYKQIPGKQLYVLFVTSDLFFWKQSRIPLLDYYQIIFYDIIETTDLSGQTRPASSIIPLQFSPKDSPMVYLYWHDEKDNIDGEIVEMGRNPENTDWIMLKRRRDRQTDLNTGKYFGNKFQTAEGAWQNIINPFPVNQLYEINTSYFKTMKSDMMKPLTLFHSKIKDFLIKRAADANFVIELGAGRGADLRRYLSYNINELLCVDNDRNALSELSSRYYNIIRRQTLFNTRVRTLLCDLSNKSVAFETIRKFILEMMKEKNIAFDIGTGKLIQYKADYIYSHFSLHYYATPYEELAKFINLLLKPGGYFIFTCFSAKRVNEFLKDQPSKKWKIVTDNGDIKYELTLIDKDHVEVLLPFTGGEKYREFLIDIDLLIEKFINTNTFELAEKENFSAKNEMIENMDENDKKFSFLYDWVILKKKSE